MVQTFQRRGGRDISVDHADMNQILKWLFDGTL